MIKLNSSKKFKVFLMWSLITTTSDIFGNERRGIIKKTPRLSVVIPPSILALSFPYSEHLGPAYGTYALSSRPAVLHGYASGIFHIPLGSAFHAVRLHLFTSLFIKG